MIADINIRIENGELDGDEVAEYLAEADDLIVKAENHDAVAHEAISCIIGKFAK